MTSFGAPAWLSAALPCEGGSSWDRWQQDTGSMAIHLHYILYWCFWTSFAQHFSAKINQVRVRAPKVYLILKEGSQWAVGPLAGHCPVGTSQITEEPPPLLS